MKEAIRNSKGPRDGVRSSFASNIDALDEADTALAELAAARRALLLSQREALAAHTTIHKLQETNARLSAEITALQRKEAQALALAYFDELTGLPNRRLLQDRLRQAVAQCARQQKQLALLFVDLDGFKGVNDTLGHAAGDTLLKRVADRIAASIREADTACRYGGDEFVVMIPSLPHPGVATAVAEKVQHCLAEPYVIDDFRIRIAASIGTALYPDHGQACEDLLKHADSALYRVKSRSSKASITALVGGEQRA
jgi:diguanylate cyclase (GGDEF)-like protein